MHSSRTTDATSPKPAISPTGEAAHSAAPVTKGPPLWGLVVCWLVLLLSLALLGQAAYETTVARTPLSTFCLSAFALAATIGAVGFLKLTVPTVACATMLILYFVIFFAQLFFGVRATPVLTILGRGTPFWANAAAAVAVGAVLLHAALALRSRLLKVVIGLGALYSLLGFSAAAARQIPFEDAVLGIDGVWERLGMAFRPSFVAINVLLPLACLVMPISALLAVRRGEPGVVRAGLSLLGFVGLTVATGATVFTRHNIPNVAWIVARTRVAGRLELDYSSTWRHAPDGSRRHRIVAQTPPHRAGSAASWTFAGALVASPAAGEETRIAFSLRHALARRGVLRLARADLEVTENGRPIAGFGLARRDPVEAGQIAIALVVGRPRRWTDPGRALTAPLGRFLESLGPAARTSLIILGETAGAAVPFGSNSPEQRDTIARALADPGPGGPRASSVASPLDGVHEALEQLAAEKARERLVVLVAGRSDSVGVRSGREVFDRLEEVGCPVHLVLLGDYPGGQSRGDLDRLLVSTSGGTRGQAERPDDLPAALERIRSIVLSEWIVSYPTPRVAPPTVQVTKPPTSTVSATALEVEARAGGGPLDRIALSIDGEPVQECFGSPCAYEALPGEFREGEHSIRAEAVGLDGDVARTARTVRLTAAPPAVDIVSPGPGAVVASPVDAQVRVAGREVRTVEAHLDDQPVPAVRDGRGLYRVFLAPGALGPGLHRLEVKATDAAGLATERALVFRVQISSVKVSVPGLSPGTILHGRHTVEVQVRSSPPSIPVSSVRFWLDRRQETVLPRPPFVLTVPADSLPEGQHTVRVKGTNALGFTDEVTVGFRVAHPKFSVSFPSVLDGSTVGRRVRLAPEIVRPKTVAVARVEYRIVGKVMVGGSPDFGIDLDPDAHPSGSTRIGVRATFTDGTVVERPLNVVLTTSPRLELLVAARRGGRMVRAAEFDRVALSVTVNGRAVPAADVIAAPASDTPLELCLALGLSTFARQEPALARVKRAVVDFLELRRPGDRVAMVALSDRARIGSGLTADSPGLVGALGRLSWGRGSALYDGLQTGVDLTRPGAGRRVVLLVADLPDRDATGDGPGSQLSAAEAAAAAREAGVVVHLLGLGRALARSGDQGESSLKALAVETGGSYAFVPAPSRLSQSLKEMLALAQNQRRVSLTAPGLVRGAEYVVKLRASVPGIELVHADRVVAR